MLTPWQFHEPLNVSAPWYENVPAYFPLNRTGASTGPGNPVMSSPRYTPTMTALPLIAVVMVMLKNGYP